MPLDTSLLGQPVELGNVAKDLKKLWEASGGTKSRASLVNFAVLSDAVDCPDALAKNTQLISDFTREHACRAILIVRVSEPGEDAVRAWINAHCHVARAGARQICCEQLTFLVDNQSDALLSSVLLANLDSDLPLYLWVQGELRTTIDSQLWTSVDRLIFDSREWRDLREQMSRLRKALAAAGARVTLCDLNWTRTLHLRQAVAQMFDQAENLPLLRSICEVRIQHAPGSVSTALLFAAWVAAQLRWEHADGKLRCDSPEPISLPFKTADGNAIVCKLEAKAGAPVSLFEVESPDGVVSIQRDAAGPFFRAEVRGGERAASSYLLPASDDRLSTLLDEELTLGGRHKVYLKALAALEKFLV